MLKLLARLPCSLLMLDVWGMDPQRKVNQIARGRSAGAWWSC